MKKLFKLQAYVGDYYKWKFIADMWDEYEGKIIVSQMNSQKSYIQLYKLMTAEEYKEVSKKRYQGEELLKLLEENRIVLSNII